MKKCTKCEKPKSTSEFNKDKSKSDGLQCWCRCCKKSYNEINKDATSERSKKYNRTNIRNISKQKKQYYGDNADTILERTKKYYKNNKEKRIEYQKKYYKQHKEQVKKRVACYHENNREIISERSKQYYKNNIDKIQRYQKQRINNNVQAKISSNLRIRLSLAIKNNQKVGSAVEDLGCAIEHLKKHFEEKFYNNPSTGEAMNWDNYGFRGWHIDHVIPLSAFDLTDREQMLKACHHTNLQPLWAEDNLRKGAKIDGNR